VKAVGAELCPQLGLAIPVGKDSLSMKSVWQADGENHSQTAPVSLVVSAFAPVLNVRHSLTPEVQAEGTLVLIDLGNGQNRLGGSALAQVLGVVGDVAPDLDHPQQLQNAFDLVQSLNQSGEILAYHDRSDGGLFATLCEMAFAGHCGLHISVDSLDALPFFFSEELGLVLQVKEASSLLKRCASLGLTAIRLGQPSTDDHIRLHVGGAQVFAASRAELHRLWSRTSTEIARLRDNPASVVEEESTPVQQRGVRLTYTPSVPNIVQHRPKVAIVREQGVNGQAEMAYAFHAAGFEAVDVHMTDLLGGLSLDSFKGFVACGGFSYGDVLGAGQGWAQSILLNQKARNALQAFFHRPDTFALGVCNGCQMMSSLKDLMPGAAHWPAFKRNLSEQFEARWTMVEVQQSPSLFFAGMAGSQLPIAVAHGEGRAVFASAEDQTKVCTPLKFLGNSYPINPNGSPDGITSVCNDDGRITILMPHPERTVAGTTGSWWPKAMREQAKTPWFEMFLNARKWVG
jgi:phosphoribosylformylglycinamidine synthase